MKSVVITGASSGIGRACAVGLAQEGYRVIAGVRSEKDGENLQRAIEGDIVPVLLDLTRDDHVASLPRAIGDELFALINNAGVIEFGPVELTSLEAFRTQLEVNVLGAVAVTQALIPLLRKSRGRIVTIGSTAGRIASPYQSAYAASKFALRAVTDGLHMELSPQRIGVTLIEVGAVRTPMREKLLEKMDGAISRLSREEERIYGPGLRAFRKSTERAGRKAVEPRRVADVVSKALKAPRMRARYIVGGGARLDMVIARLPDAVRHWLRSYSIRKGE